MVNLAHVLSGAHANSTNLQPWNYTQVTLVWAKH